MAHKTLLLGGIRSGKSAYAEALLGDGPASYLATGRRDPADVEWHARIDAHLARRPAHWRTVETTDPEALIARATPADPPLLLDDVGGWLAGVLDDTDGWTSGIET
ncbi:MAG: bifunctional adenosylcobinamide kinase/adenosylcobinamide-phosphate guanylyltransferase, partial [Sciscionella sp.]|nr:bifunctional adenosylcobinamide kinase/adenosylcobinamide-phosphate guanylyltransferase [Sciscionella sp.]